MKYFKLTFTLVLALILSTSMYSTSNPSLTSNEPVSIFKADLIQGHIGNSGRGSIDRAFDNIFKVNIPIEIKDDFGYHISFEYSGVSSPASVTFGINNAPTLGGGLIGLDSNWHVHSERIPASQLHKGINTILFSVMQEAEYSYSIKNVKITMSSSELPRHDCIMTVAELLDSNLYVKGFTSDNTVKIKSEPTCEIHQSARQFEIIYDYKNIPEFLVWERGGKIDSQRINIPESKSLNYKFPITVNTSGHKKFVDNNLKVELKGSFIRPTLTNYERPYQIDLIGLRYQDVPVLGIDLMNITSGEKAFRINIDESKGDSKQVVALKYDKSLIPAGYSERDIRTYYFDLDTRQWQMMSIDSLNRAKQLIFTNISESATMINGVVQSPDNSSSAGYVPTQFSDLPQASAMAGIQLIQSPQGNYKGDANLNYTIEIPAGRQGMQPSLNLHYSSSHNNGWLGVGWNLSLPSIEIETRWGVPLYDDLKETETYRLNGEQLVTLDENGDYYLAHRSEGGLWTDRNQEGSRQFYKRRMSSGDFCRIIRQGTNPSNYYWVVTDNNGVNYFYGGDKEDGFDANYVLTTADGNVASWKLKKIEDTYNNYVGYSYQYVEYDLVDGSECSGSTCGQNLYPQTIQYTGHNGDNNFEYTIEFTLEGIGTRQDSRYSARTGAIIMDGQRLDNIKVISATDGEVRKYQFSYESGEQSLFKSRLTSIDHQIPDGNGMYSSFNEHSFEYQDFVNAFQSEEDWNPQEDALGIIEELGITIPGDVIRLDGFVNSSVLGTNTSSGFSWSLYAGVGAVDPLFGLPVSAGAFVGGSTFNSRGRMILIDIDGDGLLDKVFRDGNNISYHRNVSRINEELLFETNSQLDVDFVSQTIPTNLPAFNVSQRKATSFGAVGHFAVVKEGITRENSTTITSTYFKEVNGDGLIDLVHENSAWFNQGIINGVHMFTTDPSETICPIPVSDPIDPPPPVDPDQRMIDECENPLGDVIKMWRAPFNGIVSITGDATCSTQSTDGVIITIDRFLEVANLSTNFQPAALIDGSSPYEVNHSNVTVWQGDEFYFRVRPGSDDGALSAEGIGDIVDWDPSITYTQFINVEAPYGIDPYGKDVEQYQYSDDFISSVSDFTQIALNDADDIVNLNGELVVNAEFCSDVELVLVLEARYSIPNGYEQMPINRIHEYDLVTIPSGTPSGAYPINESDILKLTSLYDGISGASEIEFVRNLSARLELRSKSNVEWQEISLNRVSPISEFVNATRTENYRAELFYGYYVHENHPSLVTDRIDFAISPKDNPTLDIQIDFDHSFAEHLMLSSPQPFHIVVKKYKVDDTYENVGEITQSALTFGDNIIFPIGTSLILQNVLEDDNLFIGIYTDRKDWVDAINGVNISIDGGDALPYSIWSYDIPGRTEFGNLYRNWGSFVYSPPGGVGINDILDNNLLETVDDAEDPCDIHLFPLRLAFNPDINGYNWIGLNPEIFLTPLQMGASRIGQASINLGGIQSNGDYTSPQLISKSRTNGEFTGIGAGIADLVLFDLSGSIANGSGEALLSYFDLNGDNHPDIIRKDDLLLTFSDGSYDNNTGFIAGPGNYSSSHQANGFSAGIGFKKSHNVQASSTPPDPAPSGEGTESEGSGSDSGTSSGSQENTEASEGGEEGGNAAEKSNETGTWSIGGSIADNSNNSQANNFWLDVNGDGLIDFIDNSNVVHLNMGGEFIPVPGLTLGLQSGSQGSSQAVGISLAYSIGMGTFSGGIGLSRFESISDLSWVDFNSDGLIDATDGASIFINNGTGFQTHSTFTLPSSIVGQYQMNGGGISAGATIEIPLGIPSIVIRGGGSVNIGIAKQERIYRDIDGDGYPDYLRADPSDYDPNNYEVFDDGKLKVHRSNLGTVNFLSTVHGPLGHTINLEYGRTAATADHPKGKFVLAAVEVDDGVEGDGVSCYRQEFHYTGGFYDRCEREFLGFERLVVNDMTNCSEDNGIYRRVVSEFYTDYYRSGFNYLMQLGTPDANMSSSIASLFVEQNNELGSWFVNPGTMNTYSIPGLTGIQTSEIDNINNHRTAIAFSAAKSSITRWFEGDNNIDYVAEHSEYQYDDYGRLTRTYYTNEGAELDENGPYQNADFNQVSQFNTDTDFNIFGIATKVTVYEGNGTGEELRESSLVPADDNKNKIKSLTISGTPVSTTSFTYNQYGNIESITMPEDEFGNSPVFNYTYDSEIHTYVTKIVDHFQYETRMEDYDLRFGVYRKYTDISKQITNYDYDLIGRLTPVQGPKEIESGSPYTLRYSYFPLATDPHAITLRYDPEHDNDNDNDDLESRSYVDGLGRTIQTIGDAYIDDSQITVRSGTVMYDSYGRIDEAYYPTEGENVNDPSAFVLDLTPDAENSTSIEYDILDRSILLTAPNGSMMSYEYDFALDNNGIQRLLMVETAPEGKLTRTYNKAHKITTMSEQFLDGEWLATLFDYDAIEQLRSITDANGDVSHYTYDLQGRILTRDIPDVLSSGNVETYSYDPLGNVITIDKANKIINYIYDKGRLTDVHYNTNDEFDAEYIYGPFNLTGDDETKIGRVIQINDAVGSTLFEYGNMGEVTQETRTIAIPHKTDGASFITKYEYDSWNRIDKMTYPDGEVVDYGYDHGGNLITIKGEKEGQNSQIFTYAYLDGMSYDKFGQRILVECGNGVTSSYSYQDKTRWLQKLTTTDFNNYTFQDLNYNTYDNAGNIINVTNDANSIQGVTDALGGQSSYTYSYDDLYRLVSATGTWTGPTRDIGNNNTVNDVSSYSLNMTYDNVGNITRKEYDLVRTDQNNLETLFKGHDYIYNYENTNGDDEFPNQIDKITAISYESKIDIDDPNELIDYTEVHNYAHNEGLNGNYGNVTEVKKQITNGNTGTLSHFKRHILWDEENRMKAISDDANITHFFYDAGGERVLKLSQGRHRIFTNGESAGDFLEPLEYTMYVNPYLVVRSNGQYTKHVFNGIERIASKIGDNNYYFAKNGTIIDPTVLADNEGLTEGAKKTALEDVLFENYKQLGEGNEYEVDEFEDGPGPPSEDVILIPLNNCPNSQGHECLQYFYHSDHLGSSSWITDASGVAVQHIEYSAFGDVFVDERRSDWATPYRFTGKEQDCETGLYYFGARYYDPIMGRFLNVDPLADQFAAWSPYSYTFNNPVRFIDPTGMAPEDSDWKPELNNDSGEINLVAEDGDNFESLVSYFGSEAKATDYLGKSNVSSIKNGEFSAGDKFGFSGNDVYSIGILHYKNVYDSDNPIDVGQNNYSFNNPNCHGVSLCGSRGQSICDFKNNTAAGQMADSQRDQIVASQYSATGNKVFGETIMTQDHHTSVYFGTGRDGTEYYLSKHFKSNYTIDSKASLNSRYGNIGGHYNIQSKYKNDYLKF